jgi:hypothetical protein
LYEITSFCVASDQRAKLSTTNFEDDQRSSEKFGGRSAKLALENSEVDNTYFSLKNVKSFSNARFAKRPLVRGLRAPMELKLETTKGGLLPNEDFIGEVADIKSSASFAERLSDATQNSDSSTDESRERSSKDSETYESKTFYMNKIKNRLVLDVRKLFALDFDPCFEQATKLPSHIFSIYKHLPPSSIFFYNYVANKTTRNYFLEAMTISNIMAWL